MPHGYSSSSNVITERQSEILHASCVAVANSAVLIIGPSGSGKSSLALQLMALGGVLVSDDCTSVARQGSQILAHPVSNIKGLIEARGVGLLSAETCEAAYIRLIVDMEQEELDRLPEFHDYSLLGQKFPLLRKVNAPHFPAAILQYLKGGRCA